MPQLNDTHAVAAFVRSRRRQLGLSQAELASRAGMTREWVVRLEKGNPRAELAKVLDTLTALQAVPRVLEEATAGPGERDPFEDVWTNL